MTRSPTKDLGIPLVGVIDLILPDSDGPTIADFKSVARSGEPLGDHARDPAVELQLPVSAGVAGPEGALGNPQPGENQDSAGPISSLWSAIQSPLSAVVQCHYGPTSTIWTAADSSFGRDWAVAAANSGRRSAGRGPGDIYIYPRTNVAALAGRPACTLAAGCPGDRAGRSRLRDLARAEKIKSIFQRGGTMDLVVLIIIAGVVYYIYRAGKRTGSRKGYAAGRFCRCHR